MLILPGMHLAGVSGLLIISAVYFMIAPVNSFDGSVMHQFESDNDKSLHSIFRPFCGFPDPQDAMFPPEVCGTALIEEDCLDNRGFYAGRCIWENGSCFSDAVGEETDCNEVVDERICVASSFSVLRHCLWYGVPPSPGPESASPSSELMNDSPTETPAALNFKGIVPFGRYCGFRYIHDPWFSPEFCSTALDEEDCIDDEGLYKGSCHWKDGNCFSGIEGEETDCDTVSTEAMCLASLFIITRQCEWYDAPPATTDISTTATPSANSFPSSPPPSIDNIFTLPTATIHPAAVSQHSTTTAPLTAYCGIADDVKCGGLDPTCAYVNVRCQDWDNICDCKLNDGYSILVSCMWQPENKDEGGFCHGEHDQCLSLKTELDCDGMAVFEERCTWIDPASISEQQDCRYHPHIFADLASFHYSSAPSPTNHPTALPSFSISPSSSSTPTIAPSLKPSHPVGPNDDKSLPQDQIQQPHPLGTSDGRSTGTRSSYFLGWPLIILAFLVVEVTLMLCCMLLQSSERDESDEENELV